MVESVREVVGHDERVLSSEVFAPDSSTGVAIPHAPIQCVEELEEHGYQPLVHGRWA